MKTFRELIEAWPHDDTRTGLAVFAADVGVPYASAQSMKGRSAINPVYWPRIIRAAERRGVDGVTYEALVQMYAQRYGGPVGNALTAA